MADLAKRKTSERIIQIKDPATGVEIGVSVTLMSLDDERMKTLRRQIQDRKNKQEMKGKPLTAEEIEENGYKIAFGAMTAWNWAKDPDGEENTFNGKKPEFTYAVARLVFMELPWFLQQINEAFGDEKGFFAS